MREIWDRIGISASLICVVHCLLTPVLVLLVPVIDQVIPSHLFHRLIIWIVIPVAIWALWSGYRLHRQKRILILGAIGITLISVGTYFHHHQPTLEIILMITAGLILASAHLLNLRACKLRH